MRGDFLLVQYQDRHAIKTFQNQVVFEFIVNLQ